jgi:hypothetical protein
MSTLRKALAAMTMAAVVLLPLGCTDDGTDGASSDDSVAVTTTTERDSATESDVAGSADGDLEAFCAAFPELGGRGAESVAFSAEEWEDRIATTEQLAAGAPEAIAAEADAYVQMMRARAELAAENDHAAATDLPADVRQAFVDEHADLQSQVDDVVSFGREQCG